MKWSEPATKSFLSVCSLIVFPESLLIHTDLSSVCKGSQQVFSFLHYPCEKQRGCKFNPNSSGYCLFHEAGMSARWSVHWSVWKKQFDSILHSLKFFVLVIGTICQTVKCSCPCRDCCTECVHYQYRVYNSSTSGHDIFSCSACPIPFLLLLAMHLCPSSLWTHSSQELPFAYPSRTVPQPHLSPILTMLLLLTFTGFFLKTFHYILNIFFLALLNLLSLEACLIVWDFLLFVSPK